jgi:hypothetical protein
MKPHRCSFLVWPFGLLRESQNRCGGDNLALAEAPTLPPRLARLGAAHTSRRQSPRRAEARGSIPASSRYRPQVDTGLESLKASTRRRQNSPERPTRARFRGILRG